MPQRDGKRDYPLAHGHAGDDVLDKMGGRFRHASAATGGAKPSAFTGERHQLFMGPIAAPQAQKLWMNLQATCDLAQGTKRRKTA